MKDVIGYEGLYKVDRNGFIHSVRRGRELKPYQNTKGYLEVNLTNKEGKQKTFSVHRIVAMAFIDNPEGKAEVNHINRCKWDNRVSNLEWTTGNENKEHYRRTKKTPFQNLARVYSNLYIKEKEVIKIDKKEIAKNWIEENLIITNNKTETVKELIYEKYYDDLKEDKVLNYQEFNKMLLNIGFKQKRKQTRVEGKVVNGKFFFCNMEIKKRG